MQMTAAVVAAYGFFSLAGGAIGYFKARSMASLIAGAASGLLLLLCASGIWQENRMALLGSVAIAIVLGARFCGTWLKKRRVMPDLLMVLFSAVTVLAAGAALWTR